MRIYTRRSSNMTVCLLCVGSYQNAKFPLHLKKVHNYTENPSKEYYDKFLKQSSDGICLTCENNTSFISISVGYQKFCCHKCAYINPLTKEKRKNTFLVRHGVEYVSQLEKTLQSNRDNNEKRSENDWNNIELKKRQTRKKKYGDENYMLFGSSSLKEVFKDKFGDENYMLTGTPSFINKMIEIKKESRVKDPHNRYKGVITREQTCLKRYNVKNPSQVKEFYDKALAVKIKKYGCIIPYNGRHSKISKKLFVTLVQKNYDIRCADNHGEQSIKWTIGEKKKYFFVDGCYQNKIIEVYGDYWHANPSIYSIGDTLKFPGFKERLLCDDIWKRDNERCNIITNLGYDILIVWERDLYSKFEEVINQCVNFLNN